MGHVGQQDIVAVPVGGIAREDDAIVPLGCRPRTPPVVADGPRDGDVGGIADDPVRSGSGDNGEVGVDPFEHLDSGGSGGVIGASESSFSGDGVGGIGNHQEEIGSLGAVGQGSGQSSFVSVTGVETPRSDHFTQ